MIFRGLVHLVIQRTTTKVRVMFDRILRWFRKFNRNSDRLGGMTKNELIAVAEKQGVAVRRSWSKGRILSEIKHSKV